MKMDQDGTICKVAQYRMKYQKSTTDQISYVLLSAEQCRGVGLGSRINFPRRISVAGIWRTSLAGRTARAGNEGSVWTLVARNEAHWFFKSVIPNIKRSHPFERITKPQISKQIESHYTTIIDLIEFSLHTFIPTNDFFKASP
jgi:hypothetical protein